MLDETMNAGMEIRSEDGTPVFENQFVDAPAEPQSVYLARTPQGLVRDDENGKEISTIFDILEPGDNVNHQTVVEVTSNGIKLDYFGKTIELTSEQEIFSVMIREEIEQWKKDLGEANIEKIFEDLSTPLLPRAIELVCMNTNMEAVSYLYPVAPSAMDERHTALVSMTLRKPIVDSQEDLNGQGVITISTHYNSVANNMAKEDIESRNGKYLYNISLYNPNKEEVADGDVIIAC